VAFLGGAPMVALQANILPADPFADRPGAIKVTVRDSGGPFPSSQTTTSGLLVFSAPDASGAESFATATPYLYNFAQKTRADLSDGQPHTAGHSAAASIATEGEEKP